MYKAHDYHLITIPISHYCEKARWGLERLGIKYYEERHLQMFHYPRTFLVSGGPNVPVLIDHGKVIKDSTTILKHLDQYADNDKKLYPEDPVMCAQVESLENQFDDVLGVESRRWAYSQFQWHPIDALSIAGQGAPRIETALMPVVYPLFMVLIQLMVNPRRHIVEEGLNKARKIIMETDARLAQGHKYLLGSSFTAADLALACMMSPLVLPKNYGIRLPSIDDMPRTAQTIVREFTNTRTGEYVRDLFEKRNTGI